MKLQLFSIITLSFLLFACGSDTSTKQEASEETAPVEEVAASEDQGNLNLDKSQLKWSGTMMNMYTHVGLMGFSGGNVELNDGVLSGDMELDMTNIEMMDQNFDPARDMTKEKLIGHLMSADFFDVEQFPNATFSITSHEGDKVMGNLVLKGSTGAETVENVVISEVDGATQITGTLNIDRQDYGVSYAMGMGDMVIGDEVAIEVTLVLK